MTEKQKNKKIPVLAIMRPENYRKESEAIARDYNFRPIYAPMIKLEGMTDEGLAPSYKEL